MLVHALLLILLISRRLKFSLILFPINSLPSRQPCAVEPRQLERFLIHLERTVNFDPNLKANLSFGGYTRLTL